VLLTVAGTLLAPYFDLSFSSSSFFLVSSSKKPSLRLSKSQISPVFLPGLVVPAAHGSLLASYFDLSFSSSELKLSV
jgi:hypothetical protein